MKRAATYKPLIDALIKMDSQCHHFTATLTPAEARAFVSRANTYNEFTEESLTAMIDEIDALMPRSRFVPLPRRQCEMEHEYRVGNEYSRVIYVTMLKGYATEGTNFTLLAERIQDAACRAGADEARDYSDDHRFTFRIWFD